MKRQVLFSLLTIGLLGGCSEPSDAGEYKLLDRPLLMKSTTPYASYPKAKDSSLCKAYEENLNSFPTMIHPMTCIRPVNTEIQGFEEIAWKKMDGEKAIKLLVPEIVRTRKSSLSVDKRLSNFYEVFRKRLNEGVISFSIASFDLGNNKKKKTIIRKSSHNVKQYRACVEGEYKNRRDFYVYYIFTNKNGKFVLDKKYKNSLEPKSGSAFNIFRYNNKIYLDAWKKDYVDPWQHKSERSWYLKLYETNEVLSGIAKTPVCEYVFTK